MIKIALSAGHHNTSGGNDDEKALVGPVTRDLARALRRRGFDVRVVTPDEGMGTFPGTLSAAARMVVTWSNQGWPADLFLEIHGEAVPGAPARRGCFAIYPEWALDDGDDDVDVVVRNSLGPALARAIRDGVGIPLRSATGVMSERQTNIGSQGSRLGIFAATAVIRERTRRMILEIGTYTNVLDLAIMRREGFSARTADVLAAALASYYGVTQPPAPTDATVIGIAPDAQLGLTRWLSFCQRNGVAMDLDQRTDIYNRLVRRQIDASFFAALWAAENGTPVGQASPLQRQTHCPINIKATDTEERPTVSYNGVRWFAFEDVYSGCLASVEHLKWIYGWHLKRHTVRAIAEVFMREPGTTAEEIQRYGDRLLETMAYVRAN